MSVTDGPPVTGHVDAVARLLADATTTAQVHVAEDGLCRGCATVWARWTPWPCTHAQWARSVLSEYDRHPATGGRHA